MQVTQGGKKDKSTSGCCTHIKGNINTWRNKRQDMESHTIGISKYKAIAWNILWLKTFMEGEGVWYMVQ